MKVIRMLAAFLMISYLFSPYPGWAGEFISVKLSDRLGVQVFVHRPEVINPKKIVVALPPGRQNRRAVEVGLERWLAKFEDNGWLVISPAGPLGGKYLGHSIHLVPRVIDAVAAELEITLEQFALFGISNGGVSALEMAVKYPGRVRSVTVAPGMLSSDDRVSALKMIPVTLIVGEHDELWRYGSHQLARQLNGIKPGIVRLVELPGFGHDAFTQVQFDDLVRYLNREFPDR